MAGGRLSAFLGPLRGIVEAPPAWAAPCRISRRLALAGSEANQDAGQVAPPGALCQQCVTCRVIPGSAARALPPG